MVDNITVVSHTTEILNRGKGNYTDATVSSIEEAFNDSKKGTVALNLLTSDCMDEIRHAPKGTLLLINATVVEELKDSIIANQDNLELCIFTTICSIWELSTGIELLKGESPKVSLMMMPVV